MNEERSIKPESSAYEERLRILKETMPECFTEGRLDPDKLRELVGEQNLEEGAERYGLFWPGKREARARAFKSSRMALHRAPKEGVNEKTSKNLIIEGENLEVLRLLSKAYRGRVKMIYIDPPYNTGNDFVYDDKFAESPLEYEKRTGLRAEDGTALQTNRKISGRYHSNWLSFMYPRLVLARELIMDDGAIFVNIDDSEASQLKLLLDEVMGQENFIATVIWQHSVQPKGYTDKFSVHHNYLLCYAKSENFSISPLERTEENNVNYKNPDDDPRGLWRSGDVRNSLYRPNLIYEITTPSGNNIKPPANGWRWSKSTVAEKISTGEIIFSEDETRIIRKIYLESVEGRAPETIWFAKDVGSNRDAVSTIKELFDGSTPFDTPKPVGLLNKIFQIAGIEQDSIILDFFAGSGTTAQAVLELNEQDGGHRQFILVQLPEETANESEAHKSGFATIAEITKERVRRVIKKIDEEKGRLPDRDRGFRVYKLSKTGFKEWRDFEGSSLEEYEKQLSLHLAETDDKAKEEDLVAEIMLREGFPLDSTLDRLEEGALTVTRVESSASSHRLFICLDTGFGRSLTVRAFEKLGIANEDVFICRDEALSDEAKLRIRELCRLATV
jgi:adenine-specific DNA-methyltransferase